MERCILPCSFQTGKETVIHWFKAPGDLHVHSYYNNKNQLRHQHQHFRNRTSLFSDQISRGNASLQLTGVQVQDQGRYKCYTSTIRGNQESFVNLKVDAPVHEVSIDQVGNRITCSSEGIYPEPQLTWSTSPPSNITFTNTTTEQQPEQLLYSINGSLMVSAGVYDLLFICTISTRRNRRRATWRNLADISAPSTEVTIPCTPPKHLPHQLQPRLELQPHSDHREADRDQRHLLGVRRVEAAGEESVGVRQPRAEGLIVQTGGGVHL